MTKGERRRLNEAKKLSVKGRTVQPADEWRPLTLTDDSVPLTRKMKNKKVKAAPTTVTLGGTNYEEKDGVLLGGGGASEAGWHKIEDFYRCPKEFQLRHIRGVRVPQVQTPEHFAIGIMFHAGRARWFANRFDASPKGWKSIQRAVREAAAEGNLPTSVASEQTALKYLTEFIQHYSMLPKPDPIAAEYKLGPVALNVGDPFPLWRTARLDDVSRYPEAGGKLCIGESKTTSTSVADVVATYELHGQTMLQMLLWRMDPNGEKKHGKAEGIMLDVTVKGYGGAKSKFGRIFIPITNWQIDWFAKDLRNQVFASNAVDWNSNAGRNTANCTRLIGRGRIACDYKDLCRLGPDGTSKYVVGKGVALKTYAKQHPEQVSPWA